MIKTKQKITQTKLKKLLNYTKKKIFKSIIEEDLIYFKFLDFI